MTFLPGFIYGNQGNDTFTKLLLHFDGVNGSTNFIDSSLAAHLMTAHSSALLDTSQSVFGGASGKFGVAGNYVSTPDSADFALGNGDLTADFWIRFSANTDLQPVIWQEDATHGWVINPGATTLNFTVSNSGVPIGNYFLTFFAWATGVWYHVAVVRHGTVILIFVNGISQPVTIQFDLGAAPIPHPSTTLNIGGRDSALNAWLDEVRLSVGIARWTANFTPPVRAYG